jgi:hypothetical protein
MRLYYIHCNVYICSYSPIQKQDAQQTGTEWDVTKMESERIITHTPWNLDTYTDISISRILTIRITVQRQSQPQNIILVTPLMGMHHITSTPFQLLGLLNVLVVLRQ